MTTKEQYTQNGRDAFTNSYAGTVIPPSGGWQRKAWDAGYSAAEADAKAEALVEQRAASTARAERSMRPMVDRREVERDKKTAATLKRCARIAESMQNMCNANRRVRQRFFT